MSVWCRHLAPQYLAAVRKRHAGPLRLESKGQLPLLPPLESAKDRASSGWIPHGCLPRLPAIGRIPIPSLNPWSWRGQLRPAAKPPQLRIQQSMGLSCTCYAVPATNLSKTEPCSICGYDGVFEVLHRLVDAQARAKLMRERTLAVQHPVCQQFIDICTLHQQGRQGKAGILDHPWPQVHHGKARFCKPTQHLQRYRNLPFSNCQLHSKLSATDSSLEICPRLWE